MRTLYLVRHAHASPAGPGMSDFDRPLDARGLDDARGMALRMARRDESLPAIITSSALRARTTANLFAAAFANAPILLRDDLYLASHHALMRAVENLPDHAAQVMLVGHNPGISELAALLTGEGPADMPTCCTACIAFTGWSWSEAAAGTGLLRWWDAP